MNLVRRAQASLPGGTSRRAMGHTPYDAASAGRRAKGWNSTTLGVNTLVYSYGDRLLQRNRDAVRNSAWAAGAVDSYVANAIGKGIRLVHQHPDKAVRQQLTDVWNAFVEQSDVEYEPANVSSGQTNFYGQQVIIAREIFEAGECFVRFIVRSPSEGLAVPLQLQIIESEQLPVWRIETPADMPQENSVRMGIEYRPDRRRAAYHFFKQHPGETMFFPMDALAVERVPATEVCHVYKQLRAGQMRGTPQMTAVLAKIYSLEKYTDSEIFRKEVSSMITGFIKQSMPDNPVLQPDQTSLQPNDPSLQISQLQPGSFPLLNANEDVVFADAKDSGDFTSFIKSGLQAFASGAGLAEFQVSGDLVGISYSSIRAGLLEFRRKCEQFQHGVFIFQACHPIFRRWLREAMLNLVFGAKLLNQYVVDPKPFESVRWVTPGWPWVDPDNEIKAFERATRNGFTSRSHVCASQGVDSVDIDAEQVTDNERADEGALSYDSDGRKVLTGKNAGMTAEEIADMEKANATAAKKGNNSNA